MATPRRSRGFRRRLQPDRGHRRRAGGHRDASRSSSELRHRAPHVARPTARGAAARASGGASVAGRPAAACAASRASSEALRPAAAVAAGLQRYRRPSDHATRWRSLAPLQALNRETAVPSMPPPSGRRDGGIVAAPRGRRPAQRARQAGRRHGAARASTGRDGFVLLTSRVSVEMVQKAAVARRRRCVVAVSAPTALAVRTAEAAGITLVAVARDDGFEVFAHPHRIATEAVADVA